MALASFLILGLVPRLAAARTLQAGLGVSCDFATPATSGGTCSSFAGAWGLTDGDFAALTPDVSCPGVLVVGQDYCVIGTVTTDAPITITAKPTTRTKTTTTTTQTASTPSSKPTQSGLAANCNAFHLVASGDTCEAIEKQYGISRPNFSVWNPSIDSRCDNLWLGYYVCVGATVTPTAPTTKAPTLTTPTLTTPTPTGPSPQMPSIVSSCNKFYQVRSGDGCWAIEQTNGISAAQFQSWNPFVDANCANLWLGYYVCVGASGTTASPPVTTTTTTSTPTGPSPQMPNTVSNCKRFYQVRSGDGCWAIEQTNVISAAEFQSWNPFIDTNCGNLWLGYFVCIGI